MHKPQSNSHGLAFWLVNDEDGGHLRSENIIKPQESAYYLSFYSAINPALFSKLILCLRQAEEALELASEVPVSAFPGRIQVKRALAEIRGLALGRENDGQGI